MVAPSNIRYVTLLIIAYIHLVEVQTQMGVHQLSFLIQQEMEKIGEKDNQMRSNPERDQLLF